MLSNFRSYQLAVTFYQSGLSLTLPSHLKDQYLRASSSIALNLAEGTARKTAKDKMKYYNIAFASLRECQAVLALVNCQNFQLVKLADQLGASLFRLCQSGSGSGKLETGSG